LAILTKALRISPRLWQAYQYRGQIRLREPDSASAALADFNEAIQLAPAESHLYRLRSQAYELLGDETAAREDQKRAAALRDT
jgi:Flp pilus assembly protein TadD